MEARAQLAYSADHPSRVDADAQESVITKASGQSLVDGARDWADGNRKRSPLGRAYEFATQG